MAGFVDHAEQSAEQVVFVVAGGDTHILGYAAAERVGADVEAPAVEVKAKDTHRLQAQLPLFSNGERPCGAISVCFACFSTAWLSREGSHDLRSANRLSSRALVISGSKISSSAS